MTGTGSVLWYCMVYGVWCMVYGMVRSGMAGSV